MRHGKGKKKAQIRHAKRRAYERHGLVLTAQDLQKIVGLIKRGESRVLGRQSLRVSGHELDWQDKKLKVLYDQHRRTVITVLPEGAEWEGRRDLEGGVGVRDETIRGAGAVGG